MSRPWSAAFYLSLLAQSGFCDVSQVRFDCAGSRKVCVALLARGVLPVFFFAQSGFCAISKCIFLRRLAQSLCCAVGLRHSIYKFSHTLAFVTFPIAFRLRKLARSLRPGLVPRHFACKFLREKALVTCPIASSIVLEAGIVEASDVMRRVTSSVLFCLVLYCLVLFFP